MTVGAALLYGAALVLAVPVGVLLLQVLLALPMRAKRAQPTGPRPRVAVLVPAHDEAAGIGGVLRGIVAHLGSGDRLLVVADNCTDATARIARDAGAEVVERFDAGRRGKGYALDFGVRHLAADPPEVVIVVDADCEVSPGALDRLGCVCRESGRPVQGLYVMEPGPHASVGRRMAAFAWTVKNRVRPLGGSRAGMPCQLMGTGMAIPWQALQGVSLASGHLAEDMLLGIDFARRGAPPEFCEEAVVTSRFAETADGAASQRRRWEHGHLGLIVSRAPGLLMQGAARGDWRVVAMALDLAVPPTALLGLLIGALLAAAGVYALAGAGAGPLVPAVALAGAFAAAVLLAWARYGRDQLSAADLAWAPFYAVSKLPVYLGFVLRRQTEWVRTRRSP